MSGDMETFQSFEPSPQEKAIRNSLIFGCILSKMDLDGLKHLRLVCKNWKLAANSEMLKRPGNKVEFVWDYRNRKYKFLQSPVLQQGGKRKQKQKYLSDFNKILKTSTAFPSHYFVFQNGNMDTPTCKSFFEIQGKQIETLVMHRVFISKDKFIRMVNEEMPNLKKLSFFLDLDWDNSSEGKVRIWERIPYEDIDFKLPSLEVLHIECTYDELNVGGHLAKQMMYAAPKLKSAGNITLKGVLDKFWGDKAIDGQFWEDKAHVIKECFLVPDAAISEDLERFVKAKPMLNTLTIFTCRRFREFNNPPMMQLMVQLLQTCSETLKTLDTDSLSILPIDFAMNNLTHLYFKEAKLDLHFPATIPAKFFPRLESIHFDFFASNGSREIIEEYFKMATDLPSLPSVKHLYFSGGLRGSTVILPGINSLFPNLINISMNCFYVGSSGESYVSKIFEKLEKLKWINLSAHTRVSKDEWFKAVSDGKSKILLKLACDEDTKIFGLDYPLKEPEIFQF